MPFNSPSDSEMRCINGTHIRHFPRLSHYQLEYTRDGPLGDRVGRSVSLHIAVLGVVDSCVSIVGLSSTSSV